MNFSVLMSVYKGETPVRLEESLKSIFSQTLIPNEIVLVIDGPIYTELEYLIMDYINKYKIIKIIKLIQNQGLGVALRIGLEQCTNEYVARMDSDDICYNDRFEKQISFLKQNPDISVLGGVIQEFHSTPGDLKRFRSLPLSNFKIKRISKYRNPLNHPTVIFRKSHIQNVGSYQDMLYFEDYFLWCNLLLKNYKIANLNDVLLHFRTGEEMINRRRGLKYLKHEFNFIQNLKKIGYINYFEFMLLIILKLPLRILPKNILLNFYNLVRN